MNIRFSKMIIRIPSAEYMSVNNILNLARRDTRVKHALLNKKLNKYAYKCLKKCPRINADDHTAKSISWSLAVAAYVLETKIPMKIDESSEVTWME